MTCVFDGIVGAVRSCFTREPPQEVGLWIPSRDPPAGVLLGDVGPSSYGAETPIVRRVNCASLARTLTPSTVDGCSPRPSFEGYDEGTAEEGSQESSFSRGSGELGLPYSFVDEAAEKVRRRLFEKEEGEVEWFECEPSDRQETEESAYRKECEAEWIALQKKVRKEQKAACAAEKAARRRAREAEVVAAVARAAQEEHEALAAAQRARTQQECGLAQRVRRKLGSALWWTGEFLRHLLRGCITVVSWCTAFAVVAAVVPIWALVYPLRACIVK